MYNAVMILFILFVMQNDGCRYEVYEATRNRA